jgi:hypothetical protein
MNNEPVAWIVGTCPDDFMNVTQVLKEAEEEVEHWKQFGNNYKIFPLYTHPVKELTDEEITEVFDNTFKVRDFDDAFLKFARAILRKAQER